MRGNLIDRKGCVGRNSIIGLVLLTTIALDKPLLAQTAQPIVYAVPIDGIIDLGSHLSFSESLPRPPMQAP